MLLIKLSITIHRDNLNNIYYISIILSNYYIISIAIILIVRNITQ